MNRILKIIIYFSFSVCFSQTKVNQEKIHLNYLKAFQNNNINRCFVIVTVKDLNTSEIKEICIKSSYLSGALYKEYLTKEIQLNQNQIDSICINNKNHYFEFSCIGALSNIDFKEYSKLEYDSVSGNGKATQR
jgi:hypothetical protein